MWVNRVCVCVYVIVRLKLSIWFGWCWSPFSICFGTALVWFHLRATHIAVRNFSILHLGLTEHIHPSPQPGRTVLLWELAAIATPVPLSNNGGVVMVSDELAWRCPADGIGMSQKITTWPVFFLSLQIMIMLIERTLSYSLRFMTLDVWRRERVCGELVYPNCWGCRGAHGEFS